MKYKLSLTPSDIKWLLLAEPAGWPSLLGCQARKPAVAATGRKRPIGDVQTDRRLRSFEQHLVPYRTMASPSGLTFQSRCRFAQSQVFPALLLGRHLDYLHVLDVLRAVRASSFRSGQPLDWSVETAAFLPMHFGATSYRGLFFCIAFMSASGQSGRSGQHIMLPKRKPPLGHDRPQTTRSGPRQVGGCWQVATAACELSSSACSLRCRRSVVEVTK
jgi:hypothetical protein